MSEETKDPKGLTFELSEGQPQGADAELVAVAEALPLTEAQIRAVLARLPDFTHRAEQTDFAERNSSLPPPRVGEVMQQPFPPPPEDVPVEAVEPTELELLRKAPEGPVPVAPQLSVTFNQPMVAVTSHAELSQVELPVKLTPEPPGNWRWVGTRTLLFEPRGEVSDGSSQKARFPMSTEYRVSVPGGVASASGKTLGQAVEWSFKTPTVKLESGSPSGGPVGLDPLIFAVFNQDIVPAEVLRTATLKSGSGKVPLRLATAAELEAEGPTRRTPKRFIAFKPQTPLAPATDYTVEFGPGTPSAEGPLRTEAVQSFSFATYQPLKVDRHGCGYNDDCRPMSPLSITLNNPLDLDLFDPDSITVTPEIPGLRIDAHGNRLSLRGQTKGRTDYTVTLPADLTDVFGQSLGRIQELTFKVGSAKPGLSTVGGLLVTLDPDGPPSFPVYVLNEPELKVKVSAVGPEHWGEFRSRLTTRNRTEAFQAPGQQVVSTTVRTGAAPDELTEISIDLKSALKNGRGMAIVEVESTRKVEHEWQRQRSITWVQATDIGLDAFVDSKGMYVLATTLRSTEPLSGLAVELLDPTGTPIAEAVTGADGAVHLALSKRTADVLLARRGEDAVILPHRVDLYGGGGWASRADQDRLLWFVVDDRKMYRPGEEVSVKGWLRNWEAGPDGDTVGLEGEVAQVAWVLRDSRRNEVLRGDAEVSHQGSFDLQLELPETMNLGHAALELSTTIKSSSATFTHSFQVQEFRRPEFEVSTTIEPDSSVVGQSAMAMVEAAYYAGGGLPNAPVAWRVNTEETSYRPPGHDRFTFGTWKPWWGWRMPWGRPGTPSKTETFQAKTDASGEHHLQLDFVAVDPPQPVVVRAEASVTDVNRQAWSSASTVLVHPSLSYVGLRSEELFVDKGEALEIEVLVVDKDGAVLPNRTVELAAWRNDYRPVRGVYQASQEDLQEQKIKSGEKAVSVRFPTSVGGAYTVKARVLDDQDRPNESSLTLWVAGAEQPAAQQLEQEEIVLVPNAQEYQPGEVAEILLQAPFYPAEGVLTLRRSGLLSTERFRMEEATTVLRIPIEEEHLPNLRVQVALSGTAPRTGSTHRRPAFASGHLDLKVPPYQRTLQVKVEPARPGLDPGSQTSLSVKVLDAAGKPVNSAEVALFAVDEAILALSGYDYPNPMEAFYPTRQAGVVDHRSREYVVLSQLDDLVELAYAEMEKSIEGSVVGMAMEGAADMAAPTLFRSAAPAPASAAADSAGGQPAIAVRMDFDPTALFAPTVTTDSSGTARVPFKLPDNLTRYRLVALATDGGQRFGKGESAMVARLPLMVRPSPPRFLNFGDRFELPIVLQNQTDEPLEVQVAGRAANVTFTESAGYRVTVPARDRVEVRIPSATEQAGTAVFQVGAVAGTYADAAEFDLPVWTPATSEAFATYGQLDDGAISQPVQTPGEVFPQFGGLEVTTSSTALSALTDAVISLVSYPFNCSEQIASRVLGLAALQDVLGAFEAEGLPSPEELKERVAQDLEQLGRRQLPSGGFSFWASSGDAWPYVSVHVAHSMARLKQKGYEVPTQLEGRSVGYLQEIERHIPAWYPESAKQMIQAYALYVLDQFEKKDSDGIRALIERAGGVEKLPLEAVGWLTSAMAGEPNFEEELAKVRHLLNQRVTETAGNAHFVARWDEDAGYLVLASSRRLDGILLEAMIKDQPSNDLIPKIARGLLAHRTKGQWGSTQDNSFVLLALDLYFNTYEKATPDFLARAWLGEQYAGEQAFKGREVDSKLIEIPMSYLTEQSGPQNLVLSKEGPGRLYYRIGMKYAPQDLNLEPSDHGFTVERSYEAVDDPGDVRRDADGTWRIKAGAKVRVKLTMVAPGRRYHVALVDPLPAGLEPMNPALAVTGAIANEAPAARGSYWWWTRTWYDHQNMRDERVEAFTSLLWGGVHSYSYVARATTPGHFVVPPTKAEEMYDPEVFGRSATDKVVVEG